MRSASCLTISLTLHAATLIYFSALQNWQPARPITVTVFPMEPEINAETASGRNGSAGARSKPLAEKTVTKRAGQSESRIGGIRMASEASHLPSVIEVSAKANETNVVLAEPMPSAEISSVTDGSGSADVSTAGNGYGSTGSGSVAGSGNGNGSSQEAVIYAARVKDAPQPIYPHSARLEGRAGRVLLRVDIDVEGKTKSVQIQRSSGSDALDRAAVDALKLWRFYPARKGDQPIERWMSIPVDFLLPDSKN